jgi:hypothetical protein
VPPESGEAKATHGRAGVRIPREAKASAPEPNLPALHDAQTRVQGAPAPVSPPNSPAPKLKLPGLLDSETFGGRRAPILAAKSLNRSLRLRPAGRSGANPWASKKVGARLAASSQETLFVASCRSAGTAL